MQYPDAPVARRGATIFEGIRKYPSQFMYLYALFYRNLTPYRLQLAKQKNRNKYLNNTLILFVNNIYSVG